MEDQILDQITVAQYLRELTPERREILLLAYRVTQPDDWTETWPPRYAAIGRYIGRRYRGKPLSEASIRYIRKVAIRQIRAHIGLPTDIGDEEE